MMNKASALGLAFAPSVLANYRLPMDPKYTLDTKYESWNPLWLFPKRRPIADGSAIADSVLVRCGQDSSYRPENLVFAGTDLGPGYQKAPVVTQAAAGDS